MENYRPTQDSCWICQQSTNPSDQCLYFSLIFVSLRLCEPIPDDISSVAVDVMELRGQTGNVVVW